MEVNVRIDTLGRAAVRLDRGPWAEAPDFNNWRTRAYFLGSIDRILEDIVASVSLSGAKFPVAMFRATDFEGHLMKVPPRQENGVATFSPFTHGNFVIVLQRVVPNQGRVLIRKIGLRRQPSGVFAVVEHHFDDTLDFSDPSAEEIADQLALVGCHGADPGNHLRKFAQAIARMWEMLPK